MLVGMQLTLIPDERTDRLIKIHRRLLLRFGQPGPHLLLDPVSQLVMGLIGGKTRGDVSLATFCRLRQRFSDWEHLRDAPVPEIRQLIRNVTFSETKAPRLGAALRTVTVSQSCLSLDFLDTLSVTSALGWLERLPGVGRKTSATVLNFSTLRKPALVLDTHHLRVLQRVGMFGACNTPKKTYELVAPLLPETWSAADIDDHHQLVKTLGQNVCHVTRPNCRACPLCDLCMTATVTSRMPPKPRSLR